MMKKLLLPLIFGMFLIILFLFVSANINSSIYSGYTDSGSSPGNITGTDYSGDTASFYQYAAGYLNDTSYSGMHGFTFNTSYSSGYAPTISIIRPENKTYIINKNLPLNFTSSNADFIWYKIDAGANSTVTGNTLFNTTDGVHTLYLFANNSYGNSSTSRVFTSNETKFIVYYSNFSGSNKGESTDFNATTYEDLQNLPNIILENTNYGKIKFNQAINMTNDLISTDNEVNIDSNVNISNNRIYLNSTALSNMNKSATLYLYGLTFTNPRILRDGTICPTDICTKINYSSGILIFNVTEFSIYSAEETPGETTTTGGGGGTIIKSTFGLDKEKISIILNPGQVRTEKITIKNTGSKVASITLNNQFQSLITLEEDSISLKPGESKEISLNVIVKEDVAPDLYVGKIIISSSSMEKEVLIAIEVESVGILLDVRAEILKEYLKILPGDDILAEIRLFNLGEDDKRKDVVIEYSVKDYNGNEIAKEHESLAIETQATFIKRINTPEDAPYGQYILYVKAIYDNKTASSSDNFEITSVKITSREKIYILIIIILGIILSLIVYYILSKKDKREKINRISIRRIMK